jgi:hypothetical protein
MSGTSRVQRSIEQQLSRVSELAATEMSRKKLEDVKKTLCVIWSDSETVINPLPGYD